MANAFCLSAFSLFLKMTPFPVASRLLMIIFVAVVACRSAAPAITEDQDIARRYLGGDLDAFPNRPGTHTLFVQRSVPGQSTKFLVIDHATHLVAEEGSFMPGYVEWKGPDTIEVLSVPGVLKKGEDLSRYIKTIRILPKN